MASHSSSKARSFSCHDIRSMADVFIVCKGYSPPAARANDSATQSGRFYVEGSYRGQAIFSIPKFMILLVRLTASVQSIMGATDTLRSTTTCVVSAVFLGFVFDTGIFAVIAKEKRGRVEPTIRSQSIADLIVRILAHSHDFT
jgi:hypothetical protein